MLTNQICSAQPYITCDFVGKTRTNLGCDTVYLHLCWHDKRHVGGRNGGEGVEGKQLGCVNKHETTKKEIAGAAIFCSVPPNKRMKNI